MKQWLQFPDGVSAVGEGVFLLAGQLGDGFIQVRHKEYRVVTKTLTSDFSVGYKTFKCSFRFDEDFFRARQA